MNEKKLRGQEDHKITQAEIDAWHRGKRDNAKQELMRVAGTSNPDLAVKIVKHYAKHGDVHYISLKLNVSVEEVRRVLNSFNIQSVEDARRIITSGVIAEYDRAVDAARKSDEMARREEHAEASERLEQENERLNPPPKTTLEKDQELADKKEEAQVKNKMDKLRDLISRGINPKTNRSNFKVPLDRISEFKRLVPDGISAVQRRFGGTANDIKSEIRRIMPEFNVEMLRP